MQEQAAAAQELGGYQIHPAALLFPLIEGAEYEALRDDIRVNGQLEPIILIRTDDGTYILDGRNRMRCLVELGSKPEFDWYDGDDPIGYVLSRNLHRRHLNESQRAVVGARLKPMYEAEAQQRMLAGKAADERAAVDRRMREAAAAETTKVDDADPGTDPSEGSNGHASLPRASEKGRAREQAAQAVNVGSTIVSKAERALRNGVPELIELVEQGRVRVELAEPLSKRPPEEQRAVIATIKAELEKKPTRNPKDIVRRHDKDVVINKIRLEPKPLPQGPFRVIMADPAWMYDKRKDDGTQRGQTLYPTMTIQEICDLGKQVREVAYVDCVLWLWITNAHLIAGVHREVLEAWGFVGKTLLTWHKPKMGTGDWLRGKTEHCIMAVRGKPTVDLKDQTTSFLLDGDTGFYFDAPVGEPSEKPDEFYEFVEKLCPGSKLEMFSRKGRPEWTAWGAETGKLDEPT